MQFELEFQYSRTGMEVQNECRKIQVISPGLLQPGKGFLVSKWKHFDKEAIF